MQGRVRDRTGRSTGARSVSGTRTVGLGDRGIRADGEAPRFVEYMDDLVDYWNLVIGGYDWGQDAQSSRTVGENHEAPYTGGFKKHTQKPVVNVGRFNNPDTMVDVINAGQCDFIGDPFVEPLRGDGQHALDEQGVFGAA
jgi:2,4-dienoyl-CoA reductase-like NADH-dependent reductase (Old Yellow Enzyme family)